MGKFLKAGLVTCLVFVVVIAALGSPDPNLNQTTREAAAVATDVETPLEIEPARRNTPAHIDDIAIDPYTRDQYPTTYRKFGATVSALNADRKKAAEIAATYVDCEGVENSQVTTHSPKINRRYWVECSNLTRLYFDEESLAKDRPVELQTKADWIADGLKDW